MTPDRTPSHRAPPAAADPEGGTYDWDALAEEWIGGHAHSLWRAHSDAVNALLLDRWLPRARVRRLLKTDLFDEAVSAGLYPTLAARADCVLGVDVSPAAVAAACRRHPALCGATADVRRLPFGDGSVDAVVSISTLDHFTTRADIVAGVAELHRVLRPGGTLVLTLDNLANPVVALRNALPYHLVHRAGLVPYFVGRSLRPAPLRRLLARQGFDVTECSATVHAPRLVAVALARLLDRSGGPRLRAAFAAALLHCERAARWPTRLVTGHFVAVRCVRRTGGTPPALDDGTGRPPVSRA